MLCFQRTDEKCRLLGALRVRLPVPAGGDAEGRRNEILKMCPRWLNKEEGGGGARPGVGGLNPCAGNVRMQMRRLILQMLTSNLQSSMQRRGTALPVARITAIWSRARNALRNIHFAAVSSDASLQPVTELCRRRKVCTAFYFLLPTKSDTVTSLTAPPAG